jgi:hypothetical protein
MSSRSKRAPLLEDEFRPQSTAFTGGFWRIPRSIAAISDKKLSAGAKLLYAVLSTRASGYGACWPYKRTLQDDLGGVSLKTIYRWQRELIEAGLLRVKQKGRGISNNYYFLKSDLINDFNPDLIQHEREALEHYQRERRNQSKETVEQPSHEVVYPPEYAYLATYDPVQQKEWGARDYEVRWQLDLKAWFEGGRSGPMPEESLVGTGVSDQVAQELKISKQTESPRNIGIESALEPSEYFHELIRQAQESQKANAGPSASAMEEWQEQNEQYFNDLRIWDARGRSGPKPEAPILRGD